METLSRHGAARSGRFVWMGCAFLAVASAAAAERVIACDDAFVRGRREEAVRVLGRSKELVWAAVPESIILSAEPPPAILYFSTAGFVLATEGLSAPETADAIRRRRTAWSPNALHDAPNWLYREERDALRSGKGSIAGLLALGGFRRFDTLPLTAVMVQALERQNEFTAELRLAVADDPSMATAWKEMAMGSESAASELTGVLTELSRVKVVPARPVELMRAIWVVPARPDLFGLLRRQENVAIPWKGGIVTTWALNRFATLNGLRITTLYRNAGEFAADTALLTKPQLDRLLARRLQFASTPADIRLHLRDLCVEQAVLLAYVAERASREGTGSAAHLRQVAADSASRIKGPTEAVSAPGGQDRRSEDATFFRELARRSHRPDLEAIFARYASEILAPRR
jgi:hypothetical protein